MNSTESRRPKSHKQIRKHWAPFFWKKKNFDSEFEFIEEKKTCFACGYDWEEAGVFLQAAHIIARFDGGSDEVDNLLLLCEYCHKAQEACAQISGDREKTLEWVVQRTLLDAQLHLAARRGAHLSQLLKPFLKENL